MADEREEIRSRIDIVDLISREGIRLKKTGKNFSGLCPFHNERRPSFSVTSETGRYKCFSCGESGDIFTWVMKRQNVDFAEAIQILAREAGVTLRHRQDASKSDRELHQTAMDRALDFFREQLHRSTAAQSYCEGRGIDADIIEQWQLGYAPDVGEALAVHLKKNNIPLSEAKNLFLVDQDSQGGYFDKFRGRLIFPIRDEKGALVAFGGRLLGDGHPKYINSGDTPIYRKSRVLYGMQRARDTLNATRRAILCEGYLDVIACHTAGVTSALASLGTSLTEDHTKLLKRWCDEVVILYDSDAAGQKAAARAVEVLRPEGLRVRVALMPEGEDPDTLLRRAGPEAVRRSVEGGLSPLDYRLMAIERDASPASEEYWLAVYDALATAETEPELLRHLDRLRGLYPGTRDPEKAGKAILAEVRKRRPQPESERRPRWEGRRPEDRGPNLASREMLGPERMLFRAFLSDKYRTFGYMLARVADLFETRPAILLSQAIAASFASGAPTGAPREWIHRMNSEEAQDILSELVTVDWDGPLTEEALALASTRLKERREKRQRSEKLRATGDRGEYFERLRQSKPDTKAKPKEDDDPYV